MPSSAPTSAFADPRLYTPDASPRAASPGVAPQRAWPIAILGVPFDPLTIADAVDRVETMIESGRPNYVVTPNVDFLLQAQHDAELHQIIVSADLVLCDGQPLVWASHWLGNGLPARVAGSDVVPALLHRAARRNWKIFLLGGAEGVAALAAQRIAAAHPSLPEVGHYSPPYRPLRDMNHVEIAEQIRAAKPDIVLVCFGCPKQEKWIFQHYRTLGVPVMIGAGATVDFLAGRVKRAPLWMRHAGMECVYRLLQEPRRLFHRYAGNLFHFFPALLSQRWHFPSHGAVYGPQEAPSCATMRYGIKVRASEQFHREILQGVPAFWNHVLEQKGHCVIDLAAVTSIDSTGVAFLAHWQRRLAQGRRNLILFQPSAAVRAALARMHMTDEFVVVASPTLEPHRRSDGTRERDLSPVET